jgi:H+/Cl- antiporter ClcA
MVAVWMALGLRRLERRSRLCLAPFAALLLFFIPFGTAVAFWIFRQFLSRKGSVVFSEDYQKIIAQTPGISPRLSPLNMLMLGLALISGATPIFMYVDWIT